MLSDFPARKVVYLGDVIGGSATLIAMVGNPVIAPENLKWIMCSPWMVTQASAEEMRAAASGLEAVMEVMISIYVYKTGRTEQEIRALMEAGKVMSAQKALEFGFVDEIRDQNQTYGLN
jgi:ATP-dependent Clp protease protease subunit